MPGIIECEALCLTALGPLTATARLVKLDDRSASAEAELVDGSGQVVARARAELRVRVRNRDAR